jgi:hypothetical protein
MKMLTTLEGTRITVEKRVVVVCPAQRCGEIPSDVFARLGSVSPLWVDLKFVHTTAGIRQEKPAAAAVASTVEDSSEDVELEKECLVDVGAMSQLRKDLLTLLGSGVDTDLKLETRDGTVFDVHRYILSGRYKLLY